MTRAEERRIRRGRVDGSQAGQGHGKRIYWQVRTNRAVTLEERAIIAERHAVRDGHERMRVRARIESLRKREGRDLVTGELAR